MVGRGRQGRLQGSERQGSFKALAFGFLSWSIARMSGRRSVLIQLEEELVLVEKFYMLY